MLVRLLCLGLMVASFSVAVPAFPQSSEGASSATQQQDEQNAPSNATPKSEAEEDSTTQLKHSASVKLLSRITGLSTDGAYWLAVILNFAVVAGVIIWASKKNLPAVFRNRTSSIQKSLEEARQASEDANRRLSDIESRLGRLDEEIAHMRASAEKEAAAEEERIKAAAEDDARRIVESAEQEIAAATKSARRELTAYAADLAVSLAAKQISVDTPTDEALVRNFAQQLSRNGAPGKQG